MEMVKSEALNVGTQVDSDEDATLNEMMGKFDESYCYEKETDILRYAKDMKSEYCLVIIFCIVVIRIQRSVFRTWTQDKMVVTNVTLTTCWTLTS